MSITSITTNVVGEQNVNPRLVRITTDDVLATVTSLNWLKAVEMQGYYILATDFLAISYNGGAGWFNPSIDLNGNITISADVPAGAVVVSGAVAVGHVATFASGSSIQDGGVLGQAASKQVTNNSQSIVASSDGGPSNIGFITQFTDVSGSIGGGGINPNTLQLKANIIGGQHGFGGGGTTVTISNVAITTFSIPFATVIQTTNPVVIQSITVSNGSIALNLDTDPGVSIFAFLVLIATQ